jgi:hypothetical protein
VACLLLALAAFIFANSGLTDRETSETCEDDGESGLTKKNLDVFCLLNIPRQFFFGAKNNCFSQF